MSSVALEFIPRPSKRSWMTAGHSNSTVIAVQCYQLLRNACRRRHSAPRRAARQLLRQATTPCWRFLDKPIARNRTNMDRNVPLYELEPGSCAAQQNGAFAALSLLRGYNHFLMPTDVHSVVGPLLAALPPPPPCLAPYCHLPVRTTPLLSPSSCEGEVRRRGEKRPIPAELKDDKYYERRRRNNQAAKKSRDARRVREDQIAWRACVLEQENASLRAHVAALRREALALRALVAAPSAAPPGSVAPGGESSSGPSAHVAHVAPSSTTAD